MYFLLPLTSMKHDPVQCQWLKSMQVFGPFTEEEVVNFLKKHTAEHFLKLQGVFISVPPLAQE